jgi:hypothetical protein
MRERLAFEGWPVRGGAADLRADLQVVDGVLTLRVMKGGLPFVWLMVEGAEGDETQNGYVDLHSRWQWREYDCVYWELGERTQRLKDVAWKLGLDPLPPRVRDGRREVSAMERDMREPWRPYWEVVLAGTPEETAHREEHWGISLSEAVAFVRESCWADALPGNVGELGLDEQRRLMVEAWIEKKGSVL